MKCRDFFVLITPMLAALFSPAAVAAQIVSESSVSISAAGGVAVDDKVPAAEARVRGILFRLSAGRDGATQVSMPGFIASTQSLVRDPRVIADAGTPQAWTGTTTSHETLSLSFGHPNGGLSYGSAYAISLILAQYN